MKIGESNLNNEDAEIKSAHITHNIHKANADTVCTNALETGIMHVIFSSACEFQEARSINNPAAVSCMATVCMSWAVPYKTLMHMQAINYLLLYLRENSRWPE